ncbi:hypothetical protein D3C81_1700130 [compost metagenome]
MQRNKDVGELCRHPTESRSILLGGVSGSSQRVVEAGQRLSGLLDLALVLAEDLGVEELLLLGKAGFQLIQPPQGFDCWIDLAEQLTKIISLSANGLASLLRALLHTSSGLLGTTTSLNQLVQVRRGVRGIAGINPDAQFGNGGHALLH